MINKKEDIYINDDVIPDKAFSTGQLLSSSEPKNNSLYSSNIMHNELDELPRKVQISHLGLLIRNVICFICVFLVVFPNCIMWNSMRELINLKSSGVLTQGTVVNKWPVPNGILPMNVTVEYPYGANMLRRSFSVDENEFAAVNPGTPVYVMVMRGSPNVVRLGEVTENTLSDYKYSWLRIFCIEVLLVILILFVVNKYIYKEADLLQEGITIIATVTNISAPSKSGYLIIKYVFMINGYAYCGSGRLPKYAHNAITISDPLAVLYNRENPTINKPLEGITLVRLEA